MIVNKVINELGIESCAKNFPKRCSGGQLKRVCIACELVSKPNILILDEPTSGLDSVTAWQLINTLLELTEQLEPVAVVITIHQPSAKLFNLLSTIYLLSNDGQCIYSGSPDKIIDYLEYHDLKCLVFNNPADFALEVASKEHGVGKVMLLSIKNKITALDFKKSKFTFKFNNNSNHKHFQHTIILTIRLVGFLFGDTLSIEFNQA